MRKRDLKKYKKLLQEEKRKILLSARQAVAGDMAPASEGLMDDIDQASSELEQSMSFRFRDRERNLLKKIETALDKIEDGTYGVCEECGGDITVQRLQARPVADYCIACKEEFERTEE